MKLNSGKARWILGGLGVGLLGLLVVGGTHAFAQRPGVGPGPRMGMGRMGPMGPGGGPFGPGAIGRLPFRELGVTDAQRDQIRAILDQRRPEFEELEKRGTEARRGLHEAIEVDPINEALIRERSGVVAQLMADGAVLGARVRSEVFQILTPDQLEKLRQLRSEREQRMQERRQRFEERRQNRPAPPAL